MALHRREWLCQHLPGLLPTLDVEEASDDGSPCCAKFPEHVLLTRKELGSEQGSRAVSVPDAPHLSAQGCFWGLA